MNSTKISFFALGGLDENGKNLYCVETNNDLIILDAGARNPRNNEFSGQTVVNSLDYLLTKKDKIKGIFLTHCHYDQCGGLGYILSNDLNVPIYLTDFTKEYLKLKNQKQPWINTVDFKVIDENFFFHTQDLYVEAIPTYHSAPGSVGFNIMTEQGAIVYLTDFIFSNSDALNKPNVTFLNNLTQFRQKSKVLLLLCDSLNAHHSGFTTPNHLFYYQLDKWLEQATDRVIISCYDNNFHYINQIIKSAKFTKYNLYFFDVKNYKLAKKAMETGYLLDYEIKLISNKEEFDVLKGNDLVVVGAEGQQLFNKILKIALNRDPFIQLKSTDTFINLAIPFPGIELQASRTFDALSRCDCDVLHLPRNIYRKMHPSIEDIKLVCNILQPKYFMPIKGLYKNYVKAGKGLMTTGFSDKNIIYADNGEVISFVDKQLVQNRDFVPAGKKYINLFDDDIHDVVLAERKRLAKNGFLIFSAVVDSIKQKIISNPIIQSKGLTSNTENVFISEEIKEFIINELKTYYFIELNNDVTQQQNIRKTLNRHITNFINKKLNKNPIVIVNLKEEN